MDDKIQSLMSYIDFAMEAIECNRSVTISTTISEEKAALSADKASKAASSAVLSAKLAGIDLSMILEKSRNDLEVISKEIFAIKAEVTVLRILTVITAASALITILLVISI